MGGMSCMTKREESAEYLFYHIGSMTSITTHPCLLEILKMLNPGKQIFNQLPYYIYKGLNFSLRSQLSWVTIRSLSILRTNVPRLNDKISSDIYEQK